MVACLSKNPIGYEIFEGNIFEGKTLIPAIERLAKKFLFHHPIVVADSGLLSKANMEELAKNGYEYIIGARVKNETDEVKQAIIAMDLQYGDVKVIVELERMLKAAKSEITIYQVAQLTKTMYQLNYYMPNSHRKMSTILQMDSEQQELYDIVSQKKAIS